MALKVIFETPEKAESPETSLVTIGSSGIKTSVVETRHNAGANELEQSLTEALVPVNVVEGLVAQQRAKKFWRLRFAHKAT